MQTDEGVQLTTWPIAKPPDLARQLLRGGFRDHLGYSDGSYWETMRAEFGILKPNFPDVIGVHLYGDEGQVFEQEQWMCFSWMSEHTPWWKDSLRSRFMICMVPVSKYVFHGPVNVTLQFVVKAVVDSLNWWSNNAVENLCARVVGLKGDWKFIGQLLSAKRKPDKNSICYWCEATKDMTHPLTDLSQQASWRCMTPSAPWWSTPSVAELEGFTLSVIYMDLLHIWNLGFGRDLIGSILVVLLRTGFYHGNTVPCTQAFAMTMWYLFLSGRFLHVRSCKVKDRMAAASRAIVQWSKQPGRTRLPRQWHLTKGKLCLKGGRFVHFTGKGWHTTVVLQYLVDVLDDNAPCDPLIKTAVWSANNVIGLLTESRNVNGVFLRPDEVDQAQRVGYFFLNVYFRLRLQFEGWCTYRLFNIRPKVHLFVHILDHLVHKRNPVVGSCWMDEDWLRRIMKIARKTHSTKTQESALQRYLAGPYDCFTCLGRPLMR